MKIVSLRDRKIEQTIVSIGAKIANAVEMAQRVKEIAGGLEDTLIRAQLELEALYIGLENSREISDEPDGR